MITKWINAKLRNNIDKVGGRVYVSLNPQEDGVEYPAIRQSNFMVTENCADGLFVRIYSVQLDVYAYQAQDVGDIVDSIKTLINHKSNDSAGGVLVAYSYNVDDRWGPKENNLFRLITNYEITVNS